MLQAYLNGAALFLGFIALCSHLFPQRNDQLRAIGWRPILVGAAIWPLIIAAVAGKVVGKRLRADR
jgi:hypothetical protein